MADQSEPPIVRVSDFKRIFVNHIRARMAPAEFALSFGFTDDLPDGTKQSEENFQVIMTWPVAKALMLSLQQTVKLYEDANGDISLVGPRPVDQDKILAAMDEIRAQQIAKP